VTSLLVKTGLLDVLRSERKLRLPHCAPKAFKSLLRIGQVQRSCDSCNFGVSQLNQMTSCVVRACFVVRSHTVAAPVLGESVDAHNAGARSPVSLRLRRKIAEIRRNHNEAGG